MKQVLNIPVLLETSLGMTTFLGVTISKIALISTENASAKSIYIRSVFVGGACLKSFCTRSAYAVKYLEMDLQFFQILKVKLLGT